MICYNRTGNIMRSGFVSLYFCFIFCYTIISFLEFFYIHPIFLFFGNQVGSKWYYAHVLAYMNAINGDFNHSSYAYQISLWQSQSSCHIKYWQKTLLLGSIFKWQFSCDKQFQLTSKI